jgi:outer membrane protein assembly factor BamB
MFNAPRLAATVAFCFAAALPAQPADWPQWRGPNRDGKSSETGLMKSWPEEGPELLWSTNGIGKGWAPPSVAGNAIYVLGLVGSEEVLFALALDGKLRWKTPCGAGWTKSNSGSRCQPTVLKNRLYVVTSMVQVSCLDAADGRIVWSVDAMDKFGGVNRSYGNAESPLVVDDKVIVTAGGTNASIVALNKDSGETVWTTEGLSVPASYCSPILVERGGLKILVTMIKDGLIGVDAGDGSVLWRAVHHNKYDNHMVSPVFEGGLLYFTSGYGAGGQMFSLSDDGRTITKLWKELKPDTMHGGLVFKDGYIYGSSYTPQGGGGQWICLEAKTGKVAYQKPWVKSGAVTYADGHLYCYGEDGRVALVPASPDAETPAGVFTVTQGTGSHCAHPVVSGGRLYIRRGEVLMAYGISNRK